MTHTHKVAVVLGTLAMLVLLASVTPTLAGDEPTIVYTDETHRSVQQGETTNMTVLVSSRQGKTDTGLESMTLVADYDPDVLTATRVESHGWFDDSGDTTVERDTGIDTADGTVRVTQGIEPAANGQTGNAAFATITFAVADEPPLANTTVSFQNSSARLAGNRPIYVYNQNATILVTPGTDDAGSGLDREITGIAIGGASVALILGTALVWRRRQ